MQLNDDSQVLEAVADALWAERHLVDHLLFKIVTANLLIAAGEHRFLTHAVDELERVLERLNDTGKRLQLVSQPLAARWNVSLDGVSMTALAARSPEPMATVFADLRDDVAALTAEIGEESAVKSELADSRLDDLHSMLVALTGSFQEGPGGPESGGPASGRTGTHAARPTGGRIPLPPTRLDTEP